MSYSYISILSTDAYLPGVLVLHRSLKRTNPRYPFRVLITPNVSRRVREVLTQYQVDYEILDKPIANPHQLEIGHRFYYNYSQLHLFNQTGFTKIVYLDADMLVNKNIDELFQKAHMSAVNSGGMLPEHSSWIHLNGGLLVIEPSGELFSDMLTRIGTIEKRDKVGGNQAFFHAYFGDWPYKKELHLDHRYNMFHTHIDRYHQLFGYCLHEIKVLHFIGEEKPWMKSDKSRRLRYRLGWGRITSLARMMKNGSGSTATTMRDEAYRMWIQCYAELTQGAAVNHAFGT